MSLCKALTGILSAAASTLFIGCSTMPKAEHNVALADSTIVAHGPYRILKLPVTRGAIKLGNPIQISRGPRDLIYVSNQTGEIYALMDSDADNLEDSTVLFCNVVDYGLRSPAGFATRGDTVYIGTAQQVRAFFDVDRDGRADSSWVFFDQMPQSQHPYEWTSGLCFGTDGWLYLALSTDSFNASPAPDKSGIRGAIIRVSPNGKKFERLATGIRSVPGMAFDPNGELFFVDNEGGGNPTEELNRLSAKSFYGHNKVKYPADSGVTTKPELDLQSEVAPSSIEFNDVANDFGGAAGNLFVSYYGPGERWSRGAISRVVLRRSGDAGYSYHEYTVADIPKVSDLAFGKDGALYVASHGKADYWYNAVFPEQGALYKIVYDPAIKVSGDFVRTAPPVTFSKDAVEKGKEVFAESGCLGCHQVDGATELLGPNLKNVARNFSREELLEEITYPSRRIKPSMGGIVVTKTNGDVLTGRVVNATDKEISLMLVGNKVVVIQRPDIQKTEDMKASLMYEGLVNGMEPDQVSALLDYLQSLNKM